MKGLKDLFTEYIKLKNVIKISSTLLSPDSFETLTGLMRDSNVLKLFNSDRELLSIFVIKHYSDIVLNNGILDYYLKHFANDMYDKFVKFVQEPSRNTWNYFISNTDEYRSAFMRWTHSDLKIILEPMIKQYLLMHEMLTPEERVGSPLEKLKSQIQSLTVTDADQLIQKYSENNGTVNWREDIIVSFQNRFWRDFLTEIKNGNFQQVVTILSETVEKFRLLGANPNIDIQLITQMVTNNAFNYDDLRCILESIISALFTIQAPAEDADTSRFLETTIDIISKRFPMYEILTFCFSTILGKLNHIASVIQELRNGQWI
jgi:hypothetical protein